LGTADLLHIPIATYSFCQDHAPGAILVEEAGGTVTDSRGEPLNFGLGRTLGENFGVVAAGKDVHARVLEAVQRAGAETKAKV
jgi:3'(2'), 5'-bisphosphate nucleotidase